MKNLPRTLGVTFIACLSALAGCAAPEELGSDQEIDQEVAVDSTEYQLGQGYVTSGCNLNEVQRINEAMGVLLQTINGGLAAFRSCMNSAPLVEFSCPSGQGREHAVDSFRNSDITRIECIDLPPGTAADAHVGISETKMRMDRDFLMSHTGRSVASVIAHEIMHNRGYTHREHDFGTPYYDNTVPQQIRACILGSANPSDGPLTDTFADRCDGGAYRTIRNGMQACPVGMYMTGIHIENGYALCKSFPGETYTASQEVINGSTVMFGMRNCPAGRAMTGVHIDSSRVMCAPFSGSAPRQVESQLIRQDMRACPVGLAMTGIHADDDKLTCERN